MITRRSDQDLEAEVSAALGEVPGLDAPIGVSVRRGAVTLTGAVRSRSERDAARWAASRVTGVVAVADDLVIRATGSLGTSDDDIAVAAARRLAAVAGIPAGAVTAAVRDHVITLSGAVPSDHQRDAAVRAVMNIPGVTGVTNAISLRDGALTT